MSIRPKFLVLIEKSVAFSCKRRENLTFRIFLSLNAALDFHVFVVQKKKTWLKQSNSTELGRTRCVCGEGKKRNEFAEWNVE